jgi:hypothetical protein
MDDCHLSYVTKLTPQKQLYLDYLIEIVTKHRDILGSKLQKLLKIYLSSRGHGFLSKDVLNLDAFNPIHHPSTEACDIEH